MEGVILHCEQDARIATKQEYDEIVGKSTLLMVLPGDIRVWCCAVPQTTNFYLNFRFFEGTGYEVVGPIFFENGGKVTVDHINDLFPRPDESEDSD
jgi:hypothetical protein